MSERESPPKVIGFVSARIARFELDRRLEDVEVPRPEDGWQMVTTNWQERGDLTADVIGQYPEGSEFRLVVPTGAASLSDMQYWVRPTQAV